MHSTYFWYHWSSVYCLLLHNGTTLPLSISIHTLYLCALMNQHMICPKTTSAAFVVHRDCHQDLTCRCENLSIEHLQTTGLQLLLLAGHAIVSTDALNSQLHDPTAIMVFDCPLPLGRCYMHHLPMSGIGLPQPRHESTPFQQANLSMFAITYCLHGESPMELATHFNQHRIMFSFNKAVRGSVEFRCVHFTPDVRLAAVASYIVNWHVIHDGKTKLALQSIWREDTISYDFFAYHLCVLPYWIYSSLEHSFAKLVNSVYGWKQTLTTPYENGILSEY